MVKSPPSSAGGVSLIPGRGAKIHPARITREDCLHSGRSCMTQSRPDTAKINNNNKSILKNKMMATNTKQYGQR